MKRLVLALSLAGVMGIGSLGWGHAPAAHAATAPNATCLGTLPPATYNNVTVPTNGDCTIVSGTILGNLVAHAGSTLGVFDTSIGGNVQDDHGFYLQVFSSIIGGNLQVQHLTNDVSTYGSTVQGNGEFLNSTSDVSIQLDTFGGNLQVNNNTGATLIFTNQIGNNLDCENNQPPPISHINTAEHYGGQCLS